MPQRGGRLRCGRLPASVPRRCLSGQMPTTNSSGLQELSMGITSVRDPGNDDARTIDRRARSAAGSLLFPHVYPSSLIDGKGPYTAQVANVATTAAEAIALVDKAKSRGFTGIKF